MHPLQKLNAIFLFETDTYGGIDYLEPSAVPIIKVFPCCVLSHVSQYKIENLQIKCKIQIHLSVIQLYKSLVSEFNTGNTFMICNLWKFIIILTVVIA